MAPAAPASVSEDAALAAAEIAADIERARQVQRGLVLLVGRVMWRWAFGRPVEARKIATEAACALWDTRQAVRLLREAATPAERRRAVEHLLEVWPQCDARLRNAVLLVLRPRHVRPLAAIVADALEQAERAL